MKKIARKMVATILGYQVRKLRKKNDIKVIAVAGSIGKTSTKLAIAQVLSKSFKVRYQQGNYNDLVSVPLVFFGQNMPRLYNPIAWLNIFSRNQKQIRKDFPYEIVVVEIGTDGPDQIKQFKKYLRADIGIITSIAPEHMQFFGSIDAVAKEELAVADFSETLLVNSDLSNHKYLKDLAGVATYSVTAPADYSLEYEETGLTVKSGDKTILQTHIPDLSKPECYNLLAAVVVADKVGMTPQEIENGIKDIKPVSGRMQRLKGIRNSIIIDDSYNASPEAVKLALDTLYSTDALQKIAVLGNMNELGSYSEKAHKEIGEYCDPKQLDLVVTLGADANKFLAASAQAAGCTVERFDSPYLAGSFLKDAVKEGAVILIKGSQNRVFAEETVKMLLADPKDSSRLVRQNSQWMKIKKKAFGE